MDSKLVVPVFVSYSKCSPAEVVGLSPIGLVVDQTQSRRVTSVLSRRRKSSATNRARIRAGISLHSGA